MDELEKKSRESLVFQKAQHIVALIEGLEGEDIEATFKLVKDIRQSETQKNIAIISYRQKQKLNCYNER